MTFEKICVSLKSIWWAWGVPLIISFFAYGLLESKIVENQGAGLSSRLGPFFAIAIISYLLGAAWKEMWWKRKLNCPECGRSLVCPKCEGGE
jgi:hypothetical protein